MQNMRCLLRTAAAALPLALAASPAAAQGPDVILSDVQSISNYGAIGGVRGYAIGSYTCNIGNQNLQWGNTWNGTPGLAMNAYRLHDGRLMQVGQSWVKRACCAAAGSGCGIPCNGQGGSVLGVGCRDIYSSGWNGGQTRLGPRSSINAYTGAFGAAHTTTGNAIYKRLQVTETELAAATFPGALYFIEGVYVGSDDAPTGNAFNNASYKRVTVNALNFDLSLAGSIVPMVPAIFAWRDHGNGVGVPDNSVEIAPVDVFGEGRFFVASKVIDNGDCTWRYEYAVFNLNSHASGGSFSVPVPENAAVTGVGFHDVDYHSGEPYDNTDWNSAVSGGLVTWSSPQTYLQNQNSNALRWGTMYNFWFTCDRPPTDGAGQIGLFRPSMPQEVSFDLTVPLGRSCAGDYNADGVRDTADFFEFFADFFADPPAADYNFDCATTTADFFEFFEDFFGPPCI